MTKAIVKKETNMINLLVSKEVAKTLLSEVEASLENISFCDKDFDELYQIYKLLKNKLK